MSWAGDIVFVAPLCVTTFWSPSHGTPPAYLVFQGKIVREHYGNITIETKNGTFEFKRLQILRVERDFEGVEPSAVSSANRSTPSQSPSPSVKRVTPQRQDTPPRSSRKTSRRRGSRSRKERMEKLLSEIDNIRLEVWRSGSAHRVTERTRARYKFQNRQGILVFADQRPRGPNDVVKLWAKRQCEAGPDYLFLNCWEWVRLYWNPERRKWMATDPRLQAFQRENAKIRRILDLAAGRGGTQATNIAVTAGTMRRTNSRAEFEKKKAELLKLTREAAGEWGGGKLLAEAHLLNLHIRKAQSPAEKVRLAQKRRKIVRRLVRAFPQDP